MTQLRTASVLIVDDESGIRTALHAHFTRTGWTVRAAAGVLEAKALLGTNAFDLVVSDMRMPDGDGIEVMQYARSAVPGTAVIILTAFGTVPDAVQAMRVGAFDYLTKPISFTQLQEVAERVTGLSSIAPRDLTNTAPIIGRAPQLLRALARARVAAEADADVLLEAESGTGKELLARFIHEASTRRERPFVAVNCAAVPEHLLESELFGHVRGAFTGAITTKAGKFEVANGGTLLLDEIGEMPLNLQPKLLRVLQEREFERLGETRTVRLDIRIIATTNVDLGQMVTEGKFRSDLFYRLNVIPLTLPPLRERIGDIELLALHFAELYARKSRGATPQLSQTLVKKLNAQTWPGNIRELANFMRRVTTLYPGALLDEHCFNQEFKDRTRLVPIAVDGALTMASLLKTTAPIRQVERVHLEHMLTLTQGNRTQAAEMLGISIRTMRNRIREYGLPPRRYA